MWGIQEVDGGLEEAENGNGGTSECQNSGIDYIEWGAKEEDGWMDNYT